MLGMILNYPNGVSAYIYYSRKEKKNLIKWSLNGKKISEEIARAVAAFTEENEDNPW